MTETQASSKPFVLIWYNSTTARQCVDTSESAKLVQPGFVQTLKHCFPGLAKIKFQGFPDSKNAFSRTFQDTLHSQTWLHEVKKCTYQISFQRKCITVNKPKWRKISIVTKCTQCITMNFFSRQQYLNQKVKFSGTLL